MACPDDSHACRHPGDRQGNGTDGCDPGTSEHPPPAEHGVEAGGGGSFTDSVPALAAGAACMAAACGGAGYRLYGRRRATGGRPTDM
ncbi:hypothetical protein AB5J72_40195 [Streptomyces sp. CG1]|uniref:hypothetical protein n=1 Tax=Streptomyces sp. CG1 TaxID=1287523 RepID=UPI0034E2A25D